MKCPLKPTPDRMKVTRGCNETMEVEFGICDEKECAWYDCDAKRCSIALIGHCMAFQKSNTPKEPCEFCSEGKRPISIYEFCPMCGRKL